MKTLDDEDLDDEELERLFDEAEKEELDNNRDSDEDKKQP